MVSFKYIASNCFLLLESVLEKLFEVFVLFHCLIFFLKTRWNVMFDFLCLPCLPESFSWILPLSSFLCLKLYSFPFSNTLHAFSVLQISSCVPCLIFVSKFFPFYIKFFLSSVSSLFKYFFSPITLFLSVPIRFVSLYLLSFSLTLLKY